MNPDSPKSYSKSTVKCISYLVRNPKFCVDILSAEYAFSLEMLLEYADVLNWSLLSSNTNIKWDFDILYHLYDRISWGELTVNPAAFTDVSLLPIFSDKIHWKDNGSEYGGSIAMNEGLPWTLEFIKKYESKIDFCELSNNESVKWNDELIDCYLGEWDIESLGGNMGIHWDLRMFEKYLGEEYFDNFFVNYNPRFLSDFNLVEKYKDKVDWYHVCSNPYLPWAEKKLLEYWKEHLDWFGICINHTLFKQNPLFYYEHFDRWTTKSRYCQSLSDNPFVPWCKNVINPFLSWWDWEELSRNNGIPWDAELIEFYSKYVCWGGWCDTFITEDENGNSITPIPAKGYRPGLLTNDALPWSINFLTKYESKIGRYSKRQSPEIWNKVFKPVIDDEIVRLLMRLV